MQDEAEELYKKSQRYDLLNQFYQASGQWSKVGVAYFTFLQCNSFWYVNRATQKMDAGAKLELAVSGALSFRAVGLRPVSCLLCRPWRWLSHMIACT